MLSQCFHQFLNLRQLKLYITSILAILQKLQELSKVLNSQFPHSQLVLEKPFYHLSLKFMLIYLLKKLKSMELTSGSLIQVGLEENMESERESVSKLQEISSMQSMMAHLHKLNTKHCQL